MIKSSDTFNRILFIIPPTGLFIRETRCQSYIADTFTVFIRPPMELSIMAAIGEKSGMNCKIIDYPTEKKNWENFARDFQAYLPDMLIVQSTSSTYKDDLIAMDIAKSFKESIVIGGIGTIFFDKTDEIFSCNTGIDFALFGDVEWPFEELLNGKKLSSIQGLIYRSQGEILINPPARFKDALDELPFPARHLLNNELYIRPDTGEPQAEIEVQRGCDQKCIFCLAPSTAGKKIRYRSPDKIIDEIRKCVSDYNIHSFFIRSDNLTSNRDWVISFCEQLVKAQLNIEWIATSRVNQMDEELAVIMKRAGCWGMSFGIESGDPEILKKIGKGIDPDQTIEAISACKKAGIITNGFFIFGFPWDSEKTIMKSIDFACKSKLDNAEFLFLTPFENTPVRSYLRKHSLLLDDFPYKTYTQPANNTYYLTASDLIRFRQRAFLRFVLRRSFIINALRIALQPPRFRQSILITANALRIMLKIFFATHFKNRGKKYK